jgi:hypothetical protein
MALAQLFILASGLFIHGTLGQDEIYQIVNAIDISATIGPISWSIALNYLAYINLCTLNSNCALVKYTGSSGNCSLYDTSAQTRTITSSQSAAAIYQN